MSTYYTRHGPIRAGDEYQDIWGADILVEFLEHPDRYQWVRFEADDAGYLDDILALRTDGKFVARQIKFTVDPEDTEYEINWNYLLKRIKRKQGGLGPSLLQKWSQSLSKLKKSGEIYEAALITNRQPAQEIQTLLMSDGTSRIDIDRILDANIRQQVVEQLVGVEPARIFFSEFHFYMDRPEPDTLVDGLKRRLLTLGGNDSGWLNLLSEIRHWAKFKNRPAPDGQITYPVLLQAARWYQLHELPQRFEIPPDYVLPSEEFHDKLLEAIHKRTYPCLALWGSPGSGKSTYLSYLVNDLRKKEIPVVRHHYFLSLTDRTGDRFSHDVVAESIMQQIQAHYPEALGSLVNNNPDPKDIGKWLESCGRFYAETELPFVVIIDGMDHVWRERRSIEGLVRLFEYLVPPPQGIMILVGTQRVEPEKLPQRLLDHLPQDKWWKLPLLSTGSIKQWLGFRSDQLELPDSSEGRDYRLNSLAEAFFGISQGHPLHLRYSFEALIEQGSRIWEETILALPPCPAGDIERYYQHLWNSLEDEGRQMLHLLAACDFPWPKGGLVECMSEKPSNDVVIMKMESQTTHLLRTNEMGAMVFHPSLSVFIKQQDEHQVYVQRILPKVLSWLCEKAPDYWQWAYEWIIRVELDDPSPLREGPNQSWVVEALAVGRPIERIIDILQRAAWLALDGGDIARVIELNTLWQYVSNAAQFQGETFGRLRFCQLRLKEDPYLYRRLIADFRNLSDDELLIIAEAAREDGPTKLPQKCLEEYSTRLNEACNIRNVTHNRQIDSDIERELELVALVGDIGAERVINFINDNRTSGIGKNLFVAYCQRLVKLKDVEGLRLLFKQELELEENDLYDLVTESVRLACEENFDLTKWFESPDSLQIPLLICYRVLQSNPPSSNLTISAPDTGILELKDYELSNNRIELALFFHKIFFSTLAFSLCSDPDRARSLLAGLSQRTWVERFCFHLVDLAIECAGRFKANEKYNYSWLYQAIQKFPPPNSDDDIDLRGFYTYATQAVIEIALDIHLLCRFIGSPTQLSIDDVQQIVISSYWNREIWLERYIDNGRQLLTNEAIEWLVEWEQNRLAKTVSPLEERAVDYARLAQITILHGHKYADKAKEFLRKSAPYLIGYGYHKDVLLFDALDIIEACHRASVAQTNQWMFSIEPMIAAITDFTDGDETNHLPISFAETILTVRPKLFPLYHQYLLERQEWHDAEAALRVFIEKADLSDFIVQALMLTVVDNNGLKALKKVADSGNLKAQEIFKAQEEALGGIILKEEESSSGNFVPTDQSDSIKLEDFSPEHLEGFLNKLRKDKLYFPSAIIIQWFDYWRDKGQGEELLQVVSDYVSRHKEEFLLDELYDRMFGLCLELRGKSAAYPWLIRAHCARHGWSSYFSGENEALNRFQKVAELYPEFWLDFIRQTAKPRYSEERIGYIPTVGFSRLVKFCLIVDQHEVALKVAESAVHVTLVRAADLPLKPSDWTQMPEPVDPNLELLLGRLEWPSLLVRERAASQIILLLKNQDFHKLVASAVVAWLSNRTMESLIANMFLIPLRLKVDGFEISTLASQMLEVIRYPSILSSLLIAELLDKRDEPLQWEEWHSGNVPDGFMPSPYFDRYKTAFLPPIYLEHTKSIDNNYLIPFQRQWAYEWKRIIERTGLEKAGPPYYFIHAISGEPRVYFDVPQSEAFRSGYLRALAWAVEKGLPEDVAQKLAIECCPIDIGIWKVQAINKPTWWPKAEIPNEGLDTASGEIWHQVEVLWKKQKDEGQDELLVHASGHITATDNVIYDLEIYGALQRVEGGSEPDLEHLADWLAHKHIILASRIEATLNGPITPKPVSRYVGKFGNWSIVPAAFQLKSWTTPRWLAYRMYREVWMPAPYLIEPNNELLLGNDSLKLQAKEYTLARWQTWHDHLQERWHSNVPPGLGECLLVNRDIINKFCEVNRTNFCWIVRLRLYYRENSHETFKTAVQVRVLGATNIIY